MKMNRSNIIIGTVCVFCAILYFGSIFSIFINNERTYYSRNGYISSNVNAVMNKDEVTVTFHNLNITDNYYFCHSLNFTTTGVKLSLTFVVQDCEDVSHVQYAFYRIIQGKYLEIDSIGFKLIQKTDLI